MRNIEPFNLVYKIASDNPVKVAETGDLNGRDVSFQEKSYASSWGVEYFDSLNNDFNDMLGLDKTNLLSKLKSDIRKISNPWVSKIDSIPKIYRVALSIFTAIAYLIGYAHDAIFAPCIKTLNNQIDGQVGKIIEDKTNPIFSKILNDLQRDGSVKLLDSSGEEKELNLSKNEPLSEEQLQEQLIVLKGIFANIRPFFKNGKEALEYMSLMSQAIGCTAQGSVSAKLFGKEMLLDQKEFNVVISSTEEKLSIVANPKQKTIQSLQDIYLSCLHPSAGRQITLLKMKIEMTVDFKNETANHHVFSISPLSFNDAESLYLKGRVNEEFPLSEVEYDSLLGQLNQIITDLPEGKPFPFEG